MLPGGGLGRLLNEMHAFRHALDHKCRSELCLGAPDLALWCFAHSDDAEAFRKRGFDRWMDPETITGGPMPRGGGQIGPKLVRPGSPPEGCPAPRRGVATGPQSRQGGRWWALAGGEQTAAGQRVCNAVRAAWRGRGWTAKIGNFRERQGPVVERSEQLCNRLQISLDEPDTS